MVYIFSVFLPIVVFTLLVCHFRLLNFFGSENTYFSSFLMNLFALKCAEDKHMLCSDQVHCVIFIEYFELVYPPKVCGFTMSSFLN